MDTAEIQNQFINNSCAVMLKLDTSGVITFINKFALEFFGFAEEEVIGNHILDSIAPRTETSGRSLEDMFQRFNEFPQEFQTNFNENIKKDGTRVLFAWTNRAEFDEEGWVSGFVCVGIEITNAQSDLLLLRKENSFLKSTIDAIEDATFVTDEEGKLRAYNRPFKKLIPEAIAAIKKRSTMQLIETIADNIRDVDCETFRDDAGQALSMTEDVPPGMIASGDFLLWNQAAGHWLPISWQARSRFSGGIFVGLLWIFRERKHG